MGDIVVSIPIKARLRQRPRQVAFDFDSGAPDTLIRSDVALRIGPPAALPEPRQFGGLGNGRFEARSILNFYLRLAGHWVLHTAYVVDPSALDEEVLAGHDLMQRFHIRLDPRRRRILLDRESVRRALRFRSPVRLISR